MNRETEMFPDVTLINALTIQRFNAPPGNSRSAPLERLNPRLPRHRRILRPQIGCLGRTAISPLRGRNWRTCRSCDKHCVPSSMSEIRLKISDLFELDPQTTDQPKDLVAITAYVLKHYAFLPKPIAVTLEGDEVVISYPEEADTKREEAARLAARAVKQQARGTTKRRLAFISECLNCSLHFMMRVAISRWRTWNWVMLKMRQTI